MSDPRAVVALIGAPGAGKTRTGKRLAKLLDAPLVDTDRMVVEEHGPIADIFDRFGEAHFRALERAAVADALRQRAIVTLGGGAVLDPDTQADLEHVPVVQLTVSADAVEARIAGGKRPLVRDGIAAWSALVEKRRPIYDRLADVTFDTSSEPLTEIAARIADWLKERS